jgi:hypothetical protein
LNSVDRVYTQQDGVDSLVTLGYINQAQGISGGLTGTIVLKVDSTVGASNSATATTTTNGHQQGGHRPGRSIRED